MTDLTLSYNGLPRYPTANPELKGNIAAKRNPSDLLTLPLDVLLYLSQYLAVCDVLCLRRTCKRLCNFTQQRAIWYAALMDQCLEHDIPRITYPFADMTARQLELAAIRPFKFENRIQEADHSPYPVARVFTLRLPSDTGLQQDDHTVTSLIVVPGGRYILSSSNSGWIRCWDLGSADAGLLASPRPVASYFLSMSASIIVQRSHESPSILVVAVISRVSRERDEERACNVRILNLYLEQSSLPRFVRAAGTEFPGDPSEFHLEGCFVFSEADGRIVIWNWEEDTWGALDADDAEQFDSDSVDGTIIGSSLLLFQRSEDLVTMYSISLPCFHSSLLSAIDKVLSTERFSVPLAYGSGKVHFASNWRPHSLPFHPPSFILATGTKSVSYKLYHLLPYIPSPNIAERIMFPRFSHTQLAIKQDDREGPIQFARSVSRTIAIWKTADELRAHIFRSGFSTAGNSLDTPVSRRLGLFLAEDVGLVVASPWTGSIFFVPLDGTGEEGEVRMWEFA